LVLTTVLLNILKDKWYREVDEMFAKKKLWMVGLVCVVAILAVPATTTMSNGDQADFKVSRTCDLLKHFSSYEAFKEYVGDNPNSYYYYPWWGGVTPFFDGAVLMAGYATGESTPDYTGTNTQIEGIDEADFVKTDGNYIYVVHKNEVIIIKAYPPEEMEVVSRIKLDGKPMVLLLKDDRLVLFEEEIVPLGDPVCSAYSYYQCTWYDYDRYTLLKLYDISDRNNPELMNQVKVTGEYFDSRIVGDYAYVFVKFNIKNRSGLLTLPSIENDGAFANLGYQDIGYFEKTQRRDQITIAISLNIIEDDDPEHFAFVYGSHSARYVSHNSIYFAGYEYGYGGGNTTVHKVDMNDGQMDYFCTAEVPGMILNQFSMDEHAGNFRIATQLGNEGSNVYVLNEAFYLIGSLEGIAPGEKMHSARFMGDRCYLVTFKKIDPFFVIDLSTPDSPTTLGELKIPGYSDYLHPYDENHIIGVGKDTYDMGSFAWYQGIKLALFDVTDVNNPKEESKYIIGDRGTDSAALYDHKAFLFSKSENLLVLPISLAEVNVSKYPNGVPPQTQGELVWQGAYVLKLTLEKGFELKGRITHSDESCLNFIGPYSHNSYKSREIQRSFYIEGYIYTVSQGMVMASGITDMQEVSRIELAEDADQSETEEGTACSSSSQVSLDPTTQVALISNPNLNPETLSEGKGSLYTASGSANFTPLLFVFQFLAFGLIVYSYARSKKK
jgi:uncharacterized secreted protein with C-terminal beta-propeller domain